MPTAQPRESLGLDRGGGGGERGGSGGDEEEASSPSGSESAADRPRHVQDQRLGDVNETEAARHISQEQEAGAAGYRGDAREDEEPPRSAGQAEEVTKVPMASDPSKNQSATPRGRPPRRSPGERRGRRLPSFRKLPSARLATTHAMAKAESGQGRGNDASLKTKDSAQEGSLIRTVATTNDIAAAAGGGGGGGGYGDRADHPTGAAGDPNPRNTIKPIRLVQSLTSSLARYRSPVHTVTFSPSEETLHLVLRPHTEIDADDDDVGNGRDDIVVSSSSGSATASTSNSSSMVSSSTDLTNGASDSSMSSHFVVTTTTLDDDRCAAEEVEVVVRPIGGTGPSFPPAAPPPSGAATTLAATTEDLERKIDGPFMAHRAVVVAATTPRGGTIELVGGPTGSDPDDDSGIVVPSDSDTSIHRGPESTTGQNDVQGADVQSAEEGEVTGVPAGAMVAKQHEDDDDGGAAALITWATNPCAMTAPLGPTVDSRDDSSVRSASGQPPSLLTPVRSSKTGFLWSSYPWLLFRSRESIAVDADVTVAEGTAEGDEDDDAVRAEDRFVKLPTDASALVQRQVDPVADAHIDGTVPSPPRGRHGSSVLSPNSPQPFTEGQSRALASLYARTNWCGSSSDTAEKEKPWEDPARMLRAGSTSVTTNVDETIPKESENLVDKPSPNVRLASPPGRGYSNGLIRLARGHHPQQKALGPRSRPGMTQPSGFEATSVTTKDVTTEIQELTSLESASQFSLPKNLLQFDFVLSSDLSSSYYGSSGAETRSSVVSSQEVNSNEIRNESTTSVDDSAMKRSSCDSSSDQAGSSGSMSSRLAEKDGTTGSSRPERVAEHGSMSSIENRTKHEPKEAANIAKFGGESSADNALKANDSSSVEVVRYRVALGPLKFSYYARGRKKR